ncbi:MAG TPA: maltose ABC transporter permease MalF [Kofleriaceae bacterium]|nr:maltose ABC transporter permease MalF [Kofleriaceae bacterium]
MQRKHTRILTRILAAIAALLGLLLVYRIYESGNAALAAALGGFMALGFFIYTARRTYTLRYLFPGLAGIGLFVVLPLVYTIGIGFTNYGSKNLLSFGRATKVLLGEVYQKEGTAFDFSLHRDGDGFRIVLEAVQEEEEAPADAGESLIKIGGDDGAGAAGAADPSAPPAAGSDSAPPAAGSDSAPPAPPAPEPPAVFVTPVLPLTGTDKQRITAVPLAGSGFAPGEPASIKDVIDRRDAIQAITVVFPDGTTATMGGLREFNRNEPLYRQNPDGSLTNQQTGVVLRPSFETGFYETPDGEPVSPGFRVNIGGANFERIFTDTRFRGPFFAIFAWTVVFAGLTVVLTVGVGMLLAELLGWEGLRFRAGYRILLFLPYAVPSFISILVFKGLFNQNFGEINLLLDGLFGIRPDWTSDANLARLMILIVNTWLGYPYFMMLCMGLQKSIPRDLYEASALAGAGPWTNFVKITWPLIRRPLTPLMVASFAFNFNNFVLIHLLTNGRPDFLNTPVPAGETDLLVTYTYRIAFESGQNFGLAAAISTIIFAIVAILSVLNLRLTKVTADDKR